MRASLCIVAATCLLVFGAQRAVAGPPFPLKPSLKFDEKSPYAMVVFEGDPQQVFETWNIEILSFSLETQTWTYGPLKGWARFGEFKYQGDDRRYYAALVRPAGVYAVNNLSSQGFWHACFNGGTMAFTVEAGKVNYIGRIDPSAALEQIARELPAETRATHYVVYDTPRLRLTPPSQDPDWNANVKVFLAAKFPKVKVPVVAAEPVATTFAPGHSILTGKICQKY